MADADVKLNPWNPITDPVTLKHIGKLQEELGELMAALSRCLIQGFEECEPVTGVVNRHWVENEIADVIAGIRLLREHVPMNGNHIDERAEKKARRLREWHQMAGQS